MALPLKKVNINWSYNLAYAIGLITSDGNLSLDGRHIHFKSADIELLEKFKVALGIDNVITMTSRGGEREKKYGQITFGDINFYAFLNQIGLYPHKSKTIKSVITPEAFFGDFLRGLFDGDGTFYSSYDKRWPNSFVFQMSFASASPLFILWLKNINAKLYGVKGFIRRGDGVFNLRYVKGDSKLLFKAMYHSPSLLFLNRKYNKIIEAFAHDKMIKDLKTDNFSVKI